MYRPPPSLSSLRFSRTSIIPSRPRHVPPGARTTHRPVPVTIRLFRAWAALTSLPGKCWKSALRASAGPSRSAERNRAGVGPMTISHCHPPRGLPAPAVAPSPSGRQPRRRSWRPAAAQIPSASLLAEELANTGSPAAGGGHLDAGRELRRDEGEHQLPRLLLARHPHRGVDLQDPVRRPGGGEVRDDQGHGHEHLVEDASRSPRCRRPTASPARCTTATAPGVRTGRTTRAGRRARALGFVGGRGRERQPLQPEQAAAGSLRAGDQPRSDATPTNTDGTWFASGPRAPQQGQRPVRAQGRRAGGGHAVHRHQAHARAQGRRHLRGPRARPHQE